MAKEHGTEVQQKWTAAFYWLGVTMSVLCVTAALARNTELIGRFEHAAFPLSWGVGIVAILAFLVSEYSHPAPPAKNRGGKRELAEAPDTLPWEAEFAE